MRVGSNIVDVHGLNDLHLGIDGAHRHERVIQLSRVRRIRLTRVSNFACCDW